MVQSGKLKIVEDQPKTEVPEDDTALVDRKELKKLAADLTKKVADVVVETTSHSARQIRQANKELLRGKLKNFDRYEEKIDGLLDKLDPRAAASPDVIRQVYKVVRAENLEAEIEEGVSARSPQREVDEDDPFGVEEDENEGTMQPTGGTRASQPVARSSGGVAPSGDASASRPVASRRDTMTKPLNRDERAIAGMFGISSAEEFRRMEDPRWKPDTMGAKGRQRF